MLTIENHRMKIPSILVQGNLNTIETSLEGLKVENHLGFSGKRAHPTSDRMMLSLWRQSVATRPRIGVLLFRTILPDPLLTTDEREKIAFRLGQRLEIDSQVPIRMDFAVNPS
ncbi:MAG: hypothetical protein AAGI48_13485 [Verrucomicrobiota bacterium]